VYTNYIQESDGNATTAVNYKFTQTRHISTCLVGDRIRAKMPNGSSHKDCKIGSAKAAVFPLPVLAQPIQSLPAN
jgi:hypothetical protein